MHHIFKLTVKTAVKLDLVDLAVQAVDGTKIAGNASKDRTYGAKGLKRLIERTDEVIRELEQENNNSKESAPVHLPEKLRKARQLRDKVKSALEGLEKENSQKRVNLTDKDAGLMKSRQRIIAGYNVESVASPLKTNETTKSGMLITELEVVTDSEDHYQLIPMLERSEEMTGEIAEMTLADAGYHSGANLAVCEQRKQGITMLEFQERRLNSPYHKDNFSYDNHNDRYTRPEGLPLKFLETRSIVKKEVRVYGGIGTICRQCPAFGPCTKNRYRGRELLIGQYDAELRRHRAWMVTEKEKIVFKRRKGMIEPVFGIIKEQMGVRRFLLRGLVNVQAEAITLATAFNLRTLYTIWSSEKRRQFMTKIQDMGHIIFYTLSGGRSFFQINPIMTLLCV